MEECGQVRRPPAGGSSLNNPPWCEFDSRIRKMVQEVGGRRSEKAEKAGGDGWCAE